jgi:hypothetical protein
MLAERAAQQLEHARDQPVEHQRFRLQRLQPGEGQETPRQVGAAHDRGQRFAHQLLHLRHSLRQQPHQLEIAEDDAEQVVEIMRHAAGEVADGLHLLRLHQPRLDALAGDDL